MTKKMKKAFTIVELLVAMAIIVIILAGSGFVFHTAVKAERTARATAEIARKLRGITDQLNADFDGLRKDAEIFFVRAPSEIEDIAGATVGYERFDQVTFFANGNFTPYMDSSIGKGNVARITYAIARNSFDPSETLMENLSNQKPSERNLARVQHFYTATAPTPFPQLFSPLDTAAFEPGERFYEYDFSTYLQWKNAPIDVKEDAYSIITGVQVDIDFNNVSGNGATPVGAIVDMTTTGDLHKLFCEGVGQFIIQHWDDSQSRWFPEIDVDGDGLWTGISDWPIVNGFLDIDPPDGILYPGDGTLTTNPNFGRAFKFTFTLYDSYGVFPEGKTFSHIIYLD